MTDFPLLTKKMDSIGSIRLGPTGYREPMGKLPHFPSCMVPLGLVCADDGSWIQIVWMLTLRWYRKISWVPPHKQGLYSLSGWRA